MYTDEVAEASLDINLDVIPESSLLPLGACRSCFKISKEKCGISLSNRVNDN